MFAYGISEDDLVGKFDLPREAAVQRRAEDEVRRVGGRNARRIHETQVPLAHSVKLKREPHNDINNDTILTKTNRE